MASISEALAAALQLHQDGDLPSAERIYRDILKQEPQNADALHLLGVTSHQVGKQEIAVDLIQRAIAVQPEAASFYNHLGEAYRAMQKFEDALQSYQLALERKPDFAEAHNNRGNAYRDQKKLDEAVACYQQALQVKPDYAEAHNNLGIVLKDQEKLDEAVACYRQALQSQPDYAEAHNNLGNALKDQGKLEEAVASYQRALQLKPDLAEAHCNVGNVLKDQGKLDEAIASFQRALQFNPDHAEAHNNLGITLKTQGKLDEAVASFQRALQLKPDYAEVHSNLALVRLSKADFKTGWEEYEWRWKKKHYPPQKFRQPLWNGEDLDGRTILVHAEQGLGDTIHFVRYLSLVKQQGGTVLFGCQRPLLGLLQSVSGIDRLIAQGDVLPSFDVHAPLLSLPRIFKTLLATIPADVPYLAAEPALVESWKKRLDSQEGFQVGICWQGNPQHLLDRFRSFPVRQFVSIAGIPGINLVSLQKDHGVEQLESLDDSVSVIDLSRDLDEQSGPFMDTAAVMMNLDLVVTCDTAIVHLAGALGVPVWMAIPFSADWRWLLDREDSPWYPSLRLFRQTSFGDWDGVFRDVEKALREIISEKTVIPKPDKEETLNVPIAPGELLDKISILEIKQERISDELKRANVEREWKLLDDVKSKQIPDSSGLSELADALKDVNEQLWDIEDKIRLCEAKKKFGKKFVELARSVYRTNDIRARLKREINDLLGSTVLEEKSYADYE